MTLLLPIMSVLPRARLLMHYLHYFTSIIMWICCITKVYLTPTSSLLADAILRIGTATIRLATCMQHEVHWPLIRIFVYSTAIR